MTTLDTKSRNGKKGSRREKARLEKLIVRLVNAREPSDRAALRRAFPDLMPTNREDVDDFLMRTHVRLWVAWLHDGFLRRIALLNMAGNYFLEDPLSLLVHAHVPTVNVRTFEDFVRVSDKYMQELEDYLANDGFFRVLLQAYESRHKMRLCQNPKCSHPYYLRSEGGKQFCSKACAQPSQLAAKRKWWDAHKEEILAARRKATKRASRQRKSQRKGK
jgi:hypothetical protein